MYQYYTTYGRDLSIHVFECLLGVLEQILHGYRVATVPPSIHVSIRPCIHPYILVHTERLQFNQLGCSLDTEVF
jgi:hypothetical protein